MKKLTEVKMNSPTAGSGELTPKRLNEIKVKKYFKKILIMVNEVFHRWCNYIYYDQMGGISQLIKWFPHIYKTKDWDYYFILDILIVKMRFVGEHILKHDLHVKSKSTGSEILEICKKLERIRDDLDFNTETKKVDAKYGLKSIDFVPIKENNELYELISNFDPPLTKEQKEMYEEELKNALELDRNRRVQEIKEAFQYIGNHIEEWWC